MKIYDNSILLLFYLSLRGPTPFFTNFGHNYHFFFLGEKVSSGIWETCPKILGGYEYQNPLKWGLIYIYIYIIVCITL